MKRLFTILLCSLFLNIAVRAEEPTPLMWSAHREIPARISDVATGINLGLDAYQSLVHTDRATRLAWGCRTGLAFGIKQAVEFLVHRTRPDGSNDKSFFSGHTTMATVAAHSPLTTGMAFTVAWGRQAAGKHYFTDVAFGALDGLLTREICRVR